MIFCRAHRCRLLLRAGARPTPCRFLFSGTAQSRPTVGDGEKGPARTASFMGFIFAVIIADILAFNFYIGDHPDLDNRLAALLVGDPLNPTRFVPFTITAREQVSPTSFVLSARPRFARDPGAAGQLDNTSRVLSLLFPKARFPRATHTCGPALEKAWDHGLWSVEIKQPQLQVARDYTPLPAPSPEGHRHDLETGELRFLIRRTEGGEVSSYLSRLAIGDTVELRGPHLGPNVGARLGGADRIVFLAGGTGIAPALQTIRAVSARENKPGISVIWANRHRADCPGIGGPSGQNGNPVVVSLLAQMKESYGTNLDYACTVDEEGSFVDSAHILRAVTSLEKDRDLERPKKPGGRSDTRDAYVDSTACVYHSSAALESSPEKEDQSVVSGTKKIKSPGPGPAPAAGTTTTDPQCGCINARGEPVRGGKNLVMVSGPEGFVAALAGAKTWARGRELQGAVGGVLGQLKRRMPGFWGDWLVLKL